MVKKSLTAVFFCALIAGRICSEPSGDVTITPHAFGAFEFGKIVNGTYKNDLKDTVHAWQQAAFIRMMLDADLKDGSRIVVGAETALRYSYPQKMLSFASTNPVWYIYCHQADITHTFGDTTGSSVTLGAGLFPYKYNMDSRNLGEYLFRTGTYPPYIITLFDQPYTRLLGLRMNGAVASENNLISKIAGDFLVTSAISIFPTQNISFTLIPSVTVGKLLELGAGVSWANAIPVFGKNTNSPHYTDNAYLTNVVRNADGTVAKADTGYYTFEGIKLMGRFSVDPKRIFFTDNDFGIFGKEDLKLYFETALLGLKNYPASAGDSNMIYNSMAKRWPAMAGVNLPTHPFFSYCLLPATAALLLESRPSIRTAKTIGFGLSGIVAGVSSWLLDRQFGTNTRLDLIGLEAEYFGSDFPNDYEKVEQSLMPIYKTKDPQRNYSDDDIKWSLYMQKYLNDVFSVRAQLASDHMRIYNNDQSVFDREENLRDADQWYWMLKLQYEF